VKPARRASVLKEKACVPRASEREDGLPALLEAGHVDGGVRRADDGVAGPVSKVPAEHLAGSVPDSVLASDLDRVGNSTFVERSWRHRYVLFDEHVRRKRERAVQSRPEQQADRGAIGAGMYGTLDVAQGGLTDEDLSQPTSVAQERCDDIVGVAERLPQDGAGDRHRLSPNAIRLSELQAHLVLSVNERFRIASHVKPL
jgi:hypothetical protein